MENNRNRFGKRAGSPSLAQPPAKAVKETPRQEDLLEEMSTLRKELAGVKKQLAGKEEELEELAEDLRGEQEKLEELKGKLFKRNKRIEKLQSDLARAKEYRDLESSMVCSNCQEIAVDEARLDEYS